MMQINSYIDKFPITMQLNDFNGMNITFEII